MERTCVFFDLLGLSLFLLLKLNSELCTYSNILIVAHCRARVPPAYEVQDLTQLGLAPLLRGLQGSILCPSWRLHCSPHWHLKPSSFSPAPSALFLFLAESTDDEACLFPVYIKTWSLQQLFQGSEYYNQDGLS